MMTFLVVRLGAVICLHTFLFTTALAYENYESWVRQQNIPSWVKDVFISKGLDKEYEFSFHLNPFYLRGDFNGDKHLDIAILIKEIKTGKLGIAVFHARNNEVFLLGAGRSFANGGDDFGWMNVWGVYYRTFVRQGVGEKAPPRLLGEALLVERTESASALIYWDGNNYVWYQQGD